VPPVLASLLVAGLLAACGNATHTRTVSLMLDFTPNAAHAGVKRPPDVAQAFAINR